MSFVLNGTLSSTCPLFKSNGSCHYGDKCQRLHATVDSSGERFRIPTSGSWFGQRAWLRASESRDPCMPPTGTSSSMRFSVLSYNILADQYAMRHVSQLYRSVPPAALEWCQRRRLIAAELRHWSPDIACLQEVDFPAHIMEDLAGLGYQFSFFQRTNRRKDGCLTLWKEGLMEQIGEQKIDFSKSRLGDNVALVVVLQPRTQAGAGGGMPGALGPPPVVVANTHVAFDPQKCDIKLGQMRLLLEEVSRWCRTLPGGRATAVVSGDFNSVPNSPLYSFLSSGMLNLQGLNRKSLSGQVCNRGFMHYLNKALPWTQQHEAPNSKSPAAAAAIPPASTPKYSSSCPPAGIVIPAPNIIRTLPTATEEPSTTDGLAEEVSSVGAPASQLSTSQETMRAWSINVEIINERSSMSKISGSGWEQMLSRKPARQSVSGGSPRQKSLTGFERTARAAAGSFAAVARHGWSTAALGRVLGKDRNPDSAAPSTSDAPSNAPNPQLYNQTSWEPHRFPAAAALPPSAESDLSTRTSAPARYFHKAAASYGLPAGQQQEDVGVLPAPSPCASSQPSELIMGSTTESVSGHESEMRFPSTTAYINIPQTSTTKDSLAAPAHGFDFSPELAVASSSLESLSIKPSPCSTPHAKSEDVRSNLEVEQPSPSWQDKQLEAEERWREATAGGEQAEVLTWTGITAAPSAQPLSPRQQTSTLLPPPELPSHLVVRHSMHLSSAYTAVSGEEPAITSSHGRFHGTSDYVWYTPRSTSTSSPARLEPQAVLAPPLVSELPQGLPAFGWGSDHISLLCDFLLTW